jgi:hypothetical protein
MWDDIWMIDCFDSVLGFAAKLGELLDEFEPVSIDFLNLFTRFIHHIEPSIFTTSFCDTTALLNRMRGLRLESAFTSDDGTQELFERLYLIGCQNDEDLCKRVSKLFGVFFSFFFLFFERTIYRNI